MKLLALTGAMIALAALTMLAAVAGASDDDDGQEISGVITTTVTIDENSRLVGDVTCAVVNGPCIRFGASHIKLRLNGFTMTGPADPPNNCLTPANFLPEDGITTDGQSHVAILGPGLVQKFRRHGLFLDRSRKVTVRHVTSHHNCFSGIQMISASESVIEENVSVRNASASGVNACGGTCIFQSDNNRVRRNEYSGNGSVAAPNNDFGVGILTGSDGNRVEENGIGGNTNGIWVSAAVGSGNLVRRNVIAGNPPVELGVTGGADIRDNSPAGTVTYKENLCLTYVGTGAAPCPNIPRFAGHRNASGGDD
jgi:parallel beta-helix repeat protein